MYVISLVHVVASQTLSSKLADLSSEALDYLKAETSGLVPHTLHLDYDYWTAGKGSVPLSFHVLWSSHV